MTNSRSIVAVSPDGTSAYIAQPSLAGGAVGIFDRDPATGALTRKLGTAGCIAANATDDCRAGNGLNNAWTLAVSPNGKNVYVASGGWRGGGAVAIFDRAADGALTQPAGATGCFDEDDVSVCADGDGVSGGAAAVEVSPDGKNVYVGTGAGGGAIVMFHRDTTTGGLTQDLAPAGCVSHDGSGDCVAAPLGLGGSFQTNSIAVSSDGKNVYLTGFDTGMASFNRDLTTGALTQKSADAGGFVSNGGDFLRVVLSPDGKNAYLTTGNNGQLFLFDRDPATGVLTEKEGDAGVVSTGDALYAPAAISPDGLSLYTAGGRGVAIFDRDPAGVLTQKAGNAGCIFEIGDGETCALGRVVGGAEGASVSPDGKNLYVVAGRHSSTTGGRQPAAGLAILTRELAPPDTAITSGPAQGSSTADTTPTFTFTSTQAGSTFHCRIDGGAAFACTSPYTTSTLSAGIHTFSVAAVNDQGKVDATSATRTFGIVVSGIVVSGGGAQVGRTINGTGGNDRLSGTPGNDVINCGAGDDIANGGGGDDVINCGAGDDVVNAGAGNDVVHGGTGNDEINGDQGNDRLFGDAGKDSISGGAGDDVIKGGSGKDSLSGGSGRDNIAGGSGSDKLSGGSGNDKLAGNAGNDRLSGGVGQDSLSGGAGRDVLIGGPGKDKLSGGPDKDKEKQ